MPDTELLFDLELLSAGHHAHIAVRSSDRVATNVLLIVGSSVGSSLRKFKSSSIAAGFALPIVPNDKMASCRTILDALRSSAISANGMTIGAAAVSSCVRMD